MNSGNDTDVAIAVADFDSARAAEVAGALGLPVRGLPLAEVVATDTTPADGSAEDAPLLVLYQAPWEGCLALADLANDSTNPGLATTDSWLAAWLAAYSPVAAVQVQGPERIRLVNVGREDAAEVLCRVAGLPTGGSEQARVQATLPQGASTWSRLLGLWMAQTATELWRIYEILESCAQGDGRPAEFRSGLRQQDDGRHGACVRVLADAMRAVRESSQGRVATLEDTLEDLQRENTLLAMELQQVHAELGQQARSEQALHALVLDAGRTAEQARHRIVELHLASRRVD